MQFERDGVKINYKWDGAEGKPVLTLVHGVGGQLGYWDWVVDDLAKDFRILRYDQRGHGESGKPRGKIDIHEFVADLKALLDHVGVKKTHLFGFSLGGLVVQKFALEHPEYIDRLIIMGSVAGRTEDEKVRVMDRLEILRSLGPLGHYDASVDRWFTPEFRAAHPEIMAKRREYASQMDPECYVAAYRVLATNDFADRLHEIKLKTLVATGEHDAGSNPRMSKLMHDRIAGSRFHIFPKLRHNLLFEAPLQVSGLVRDFLQN